jgi:hypothetical protein
MPDIYRTLRVIEVVGTLEFINMQKTKDQLKGTKTTHYNGTECHLHSAYLGEPVLLHKASGDIDANAKG